MVQIKEFLKKKPPLSGQEGFKRCSYGWRMTDENRAVFYRYSGMEEAYNGAVEFNKTWHGTLFA